MHACMHVRRNTNPYNYVRENNKLGETRIPANTGVSAIVHPATDHVLPLNI